MAKINISPKIALYLFIFLTVVLVAMSVWWITLMAQLLNEKVDLAHELGATDERIQLIQDEEIKRQVMVGLEGITFLLIVGFGAGIIYRSFVNNQQLNYRQQNFLMAVTHELKTPLASMKIYLDTLKSEKVPNERKIQIIPRIKEDVERMEKLVVNILEAGRFEKNTYQVHRENIDLSHIIELSLEKLQSYSLKKDLIINRDNLAPNLEFYGDPYALGRAFDAILENSLKYNDKDAIQIEIAMSRKDSYILIDITDNGIGLNKSDFDKIFERFYRVGHELNRSKPGSGLGLYLCREIIKAHDGSISVTSDGAGKGVKYHIKLKSGK